MSDKRLLREDPYFAEVARLPRGYYWVRSNDEDSPPDRFIIEIVGPDRIVKMYEESYDSYSQAEQFYRFRDYAPVPTEAEVEELETRIRYLETVDLEAGEFNED